MLIDNRDTFKGNDFESMYQFFKHNLKTGKFDVVSGYFSVEMLATFYKEFADIQRYRLILGNLINDEKTAVAQINLLANNPEAGLLEDFQLSDRANDAVKFLQQAEVRTYEKKFCHAKAYIYTDEKNPTNSFFSVGSSNFTSAGLRGDKNGNVELNYLKTGNNTQFRRIKEEWFNKELWVDSATIITTDKVAKTKENYKEYLIRLIQRLYRHYEPLEIYYKILFELFYEQIQEQDFEEGTKKLEHLEDSQIWQRLFSFQKQGVLGIIRMLQKYNGAILADAVGLGKTWQALAVIKFFELEGYRVVILCPKKLSQNWTKFLVNEDSLFESDKFTYMVRYHTDLQKDEEKGTNRMTKNDHKIDSFIHNPKILFVIDESHNLRNDKSSRYQFLVDELLRQNKDVKTLLLSATPINNNLNDIRNQFKLLAKGNDKGFENTLKVHSLESLFRQIQTKYRDWKDSDLPVNQFIKVVSQDFFRLVDSLVMARTRPMIEKNLQNSNLSTHEQSKIQARLQFPKKSKPINCYHLPEKFGRLQGSEQILKKLEELHFWGYQPAKFTRKDGGWKKEKKQAFEDESIRQGFLARMMFFLLMKRLESSWFSFYSTLQKIHAHHQNALEKVEAFIRKEDRAEKITLGLEIDEEDEAIYEEQGEEYYQLGKNNPIPLENIADIQYYKKHLNAELKRLKALLKNVENYKTKFQKGEQEDTKLAELIRQIEAKRNGKQNKKVLIFTAFKNTADYLYQQLQQHFKKDGIAVVSGDGAVSSYGYVGKNFEPVLEQFAPYTKLYKEKDWIKPYLEATEPNYTTLTPAEIEQKHHKITFAIWKKYMLKNHPINKQILSQPIDILITTDCLSEGQNLQDCDCVINYDIHWNPVRLIQRFGRIDRLGSPNKTVFGINFWIGKNFEDVMNLKGRVEKRMAIMALAGTETMDKLTPEMEELMNNNPLITKQDEKMMRNMETSWEDIEVNPKTLSLANFSLEVFRNELREFLFKNRRMLEEMPHAIFSGLQIPKKLTPQTVTSQNVVALLRHKNDGALHLAICNENGQRVFENRHEQLNFLRMTKNEKRCDTHQDVPPVEELRKYGQMLIEHLPNMNQKQVKNDLRAIAKLGLSASRQLGKANNRSKNYYKPENFELIVWEFLKK